MGKINATDRDGKHYQLEARERTSLMEILRQGGLSLEALCGGSCLCATCHVFVEATWLDKLLPATEAEVFTLQDEAEDIQPNSRLSCQIQWHQGLDGIQLSIAPEI